MIEKVLEKRNLNDAYKRVVSNGGSAGVDGLQVSDLSTYLSAHGNNLVDMIRCGSYLPNPIKGVSIPKSSEERKIL